MKTTTTTPLVSALCVTNRPKCQDWLRWNVQRQTYPRLDIVVVDASEGLELHGPRDFIWPHDRYECLDAKAGRLTRAPEWSRCGQLRNVAMSLARGEYFVWFDDDDWYHPERVEWLVSAIEEIGTPWLGWGCGYFMDLASRQGFYLPSRIRPPRVINGAAIYRTEACAKVAYDAEPVGSDARWLRTLAAFHGVQGHVLLDKRLHAIFMQHGEQTSKTLRNVGRPLMLGDFRQKAGAWWGSTSARLGLLEAALHSPL
ncbi:MAG TPA: glycosyltransferase family A protein [Myxococcota bacterium]